MQFVTPLLEGLKVNLEILVVSTLLAFLMAFLAGFGRLAKYRVVRGITLVYVEVFRGTSLLVQLFWMYFALPAMHVNVSAMAAAIIALGLNYGAYGSEVVRSCLLAVPKGQTEASIALNMTYPLRMRRIILPQAWRMMLPGFGNLQIELLKGTSLVYLITLADITYKGMILRSANISQQSLIFAWMLVIYFVVAYALVLLIRYFERRAAVGRG
ncbi:ectoine/hydroxyectoine ABC transporter permease subunit EhuC [Cohnella lubricantis]|uniref:Ectoine/hydroxyectoine ABC transporter permease subunit EhuC n=1 Tax=Cohnella lubricantis TaxID=2163172 RepID=A0A841TA98_9BACL|nr:ectoine/hydroxyectoine ABC transporter permease subunit EhuC [Cohnella lubricantis]MBB6678224.1 ectoine/hydroxyectoine ABC transporter permease subunit EhuC [Cohnella lubricantis]MBP2120079.1 polar amino acid transport system permease protein [Cohnella lubricantis]